MASKNQTRLSDYFGVKKNTSIERNVKTDKASIVKVDLPQTRSTTPKRKLEAESTTSEQETKKRKIVKKNLPTKISKNLKAELREKLAALSSATPPLVKEPAAVNKLKVDEKPAFEHYYDLSFKTSSLRLPRKYKIIAAMFISMDITVSILYNRGEVCTFLKVKKAVQEMTNKNFCMSRLAQITTVFPDAYNFTCEKYNDFSLEKNKANGNYHLIITPVIPTSQTSENKLNSSLLQIRKNYFNSRLLDITKDHFMTFLSNLNTPIVIEREKIENWHSKFELEQVADIPEANLPNPSNTLTAMSAKDVLEKVKGLYGKRVETALENVAKMVSEANEAPSEIKLQPRKNADALKGIPQALLDKIRAKELAKMKDELTRPPKECKRRAMIAKIPEIARIMRSYFVTERKSAILRETVVSKIKDSLSTNSSQTEINDHIKLIAELSPKWLCIITVSKGVYIKINKDMNLNIVLKNIEEEKLVDK